MPNPHIAISITLCVTTLFLTMTACSPAPSDEGVPDMSTPKDMTRVDDADTGSQPDAMMAPDSDSAPVLPPFPSTGCEGTSPWTPGQTSLETVQRDGQERSWLVRLPDAYTPGEPLPILFALHGGFGSGERTAQITRFDAIADRERVIMIYPDGHAQRPNANSDLLRTRTWNAGSCCGNAEEQDVDDVGFLLEILDDVEARACVDRRRVYVTGMSNGGMMSYRLACEASERFAAFAPVASSLVLDMCQPARPVPLLHIHGLEDPNVPFEGGAGCGLGELEGSQPVGDVIDAWAERSGCTQDHTTLLERADVTCIARDGCARRVQLCTVNQAGHVWPGGLEGSTTTSPDCPDDRGHVASFDASSRIMNFVLSHALESPVQ